MCLRGQRCCTFTTWTGEARNTSLFCGVSPSRLAGISRISVSHQSFLFRNGFESIEHPLQYAGIRQGRIVAVLKRALNAGCKTQLMCELVDTEGKRQPARANLF